MHGIIIIACAFFLSAQAFPDGWRPGGPGGGAEQIQPVWYRRLRLLLGSDQVPPGPQGSAGVTRHLEQLPVDAEDPEEIQLCLPHVSHRCRSHRITLHEIKSALAAFQINTLEAGYCETGF